MKIFSRQHSLEYVGFKGTSTVCRTCATVPVSREDVMTHLTSNTMQWWNVVTERSIIKSEAGSLNIAENISPLPDIPSLKWPDGVAASLPGWSQLEPRSHEARAHPVSWCWWVQAVIAVSASSVSSVGVSQHAAEHWVTVSRAQVKTTRHFHQRVRTVTKTSKWSQWSDTKSSLEESCLLVLFTR